MLGHSVVLKRAWPDQHHRAAIDPATVLGDVPVETLKPAYTAATLPDSFALPPGTFFDAASIHMLASGTLSHLRILTGENLRVAPHRFRPNIVIETEAGLAGFVEDRWLDGTLHVGERVRIVQMRLTRVESPTISDRLATRYAASADGRPCTVRDAQTATARSVR